MADLKIGVVGLPGRWSTETLADAVQERTGYRLVIDLGAVSLDLATGRLCLRDHNLCDLDGLLVKKVSPVYSPNTLDRLELLRVAERAGVRVFSPAERILRLVDRLSCTVTLRNHGIPMPDTLITEDIADAMDAVQRFGSAVFKPLYSTKARGMRVIDAEHDPEDVRDQVQAFAADHPMMYIQRKIELPGADLGLLFLGGDYLGSYARIAGDAWNTTIRSGGRYAAASPDPAVIEMARRAQAPFGMDYTTVDVAETDDGPVVFEVSAFGGFRGAQEGLGLDVAGRYVDYAIAELSSAKA